MNASHGEPTLPPRLRRPLVAVWISLALHAALIALLQVAPPAAEGTGAPVIEVRLVPAHAVPDAVAPSVAAPELAPSPVPTPQPVVQPQPEPAVPPAPAAAEAASPTPTPAADTPAASERPRAHAPALAIDSGVDLTYYSARELDVQPRALREILPEYPSDADRQQLSGKVRLLLKLEADGRVSDVEVVSATPPGRFETSALKAFRDARFAPAQKNGRPVRARVLIEVEYDWEGRR